MSLVRPAWSARPPRSSVKGGEEGLQAGMQDDRESSHENPRIRVGSGRNHPTSPPTHHPSSSPHRPPPPKVEAIPPPQEDAEMDDLVASFGDALAFVPRGVRRRERERERERGMQVER